MFPFLKSGITIANFFPVRVLPYCNEALNTRVKHGDNSLATSFNSLDNDNNDNDIALQYNSKYIAIIKDQ